MIVSPKLQVYGPLETEVKAPGVGVSVTVIVVAPTSVVLDESVVCKLMSKVPVEAQAKLTDAPEDSKVPSLSKSQAKV